MNMMKTLSSNNCDVMDLNITLPYLDNNTPGNLYTDVNKYVRPVDEDLFIDC